MKNNNNIQSADINRYQRNGINGVYLERKISKYQCGGIAGAQRKMAWRRGVSMWRRLESANGVAASKLCNHQL
jgi:hypothetical protein